MRRSPVLQKSRLRGGAAALIAVAAGLACASEAAARGGGHAASVQHGAAPRAPAPAVKVGRLGGHHHHIGVRNRRAYYPGGGWGYGGYVTGAEAGAPAYVEPSSRTDFLYSQSVVIHRGPAFGEPGYYAHPSIYRIVPETRKRVGTRRYRVERTDF